MYSFLALFNVIIIVFIVVLILSIIVVIVCAKDTTQARVCAARPGVAPPQRVATVVVPLAAFHLQCMGHLRAVQACPTTLREV